MLNDCFVFYLKVNFFEKVFSLFEIAHKEVKPENIVSPSYVPYRTYRD